MKNNDLVFFSNKFSYSHFSIKREKLSGKVQAIKGLPGMPE